MSFANCTGTPGPLPILAHQCYGAQQCGGVCGIGMCRVHLHACSNRLLQSCAHSCSLPLPPPSHPFPLNYPPKPSPLLQPCPTCPSALTAASRACAPMLTWQPTSLPSAPTRPTPTPGRLPPCCRDAPPLLRRRHRQRALRGRTAWLRRRRSLRKPRRQHSASWRHRRLHSWGAPCWLPCSSELPCACACIAMPSGASCLA